MNEENRIPEEYIVNEGNETGVTMDYIEQLIRSGLRDSGLVLRAPNADEHPDVPRPEDVDTGDRKRLFKGIKQITFDEYEALTEEDRKQYMFFVRESSGATFGFIGIGNLKYTMVPEDIRGVDCGMFDCPVPVPPDPMEGYFSVNAITPGVFTITTTGDTTYPFSHRLNGGEWVDDFVDLVSRNEIHLNAGDVLEIKSVRNNFADFNPPTQENKIHGITFGDDSGLTYSISNNIMSLLYGDYFIGVDAFPNNNAVNYAFGGLFSGSTGLVDASRLVLPVEPLATACYFRMFSKCSSLQTAPVMSATTTTLGGYCCLGMFMGCTSLVDISGINIVSATTMNYYCYQQMFADCISLTKAPAIAPTTVGPIAQRCCEGMFSGCTSLVDIDDLSLPAEMLGDGVVDSNASMYCYAEMFKGCTSLTKAPVMSPTTLSKCCCSGMFSGCTSLTNVSGITLSAETLCNSCYQSMFNTCTSLRKAPVLTPITAAAGCCFAMFSGCVSLVDIDNIILLPVTTLYHGCYRAMFSGCESLIKAPAMAPTTVAEECCWGMFSACLSLVDISGVTLPAETLYSKSYNTMFNCCTSLTKAPAMAPTTVAPLCCYRMFCSAATLTDVSEVSLPATTLEDYCYQEMFYRCGALQSAPEMAPTTVALACCGSMFRDCSQLSDISNLSLPATTLAKSCYVMMFEHTRITRAPVLPAQTLTEYCYKNMFDDVHSLVYIKCLATDISAPGCVDDWCHYLGGSGSPDKIFVKADDMDDWTRTDSGIPTNWTVIDASDE